MHNTTTVTNKKPRTVYLSRMCDHTRVLAAAMRACGIHAEVLPESDLESIDLGRRYTSGKECLPFAVSLGDFIKKINEKGFDPSRSGFFMPTADGPCRFGLYARLQKLIMEELGYGDIDMLSFSSIDSYGFKEIGSSSSLFRSLTWKGIVAVDMLEKMVWERRPYEFIRGETDYVYDWALDCIERDIEANSLIIESRLKSICREFENVRVDKSNRRPVIGIVGEIFVRTNRLSNQDIVRKVEDFGGEACVSSISEWFMYTTYTFKKASLEDGKYLNYIFGVYEKFLQGKMEHKIGNICKDIISEPYEPPISEIMKYSAPYINCASHEGEAVLSVGKAIHMIKTEKVSGIINILPFSCMPGLAVTAISKKIRDDNNNFPWLNIDYDGTEGGNLDTRLEAFLYQVKKYS